MKLRKIQRPRTIDPTRPQPHVPPRLARDIFLHLYRNLVIRDGPLLLGIHGAPGIGKSFGLRTVLRRLGIQAIYLSSGEMESPEAGEPARRVRESYLAAGRLRSRKVPILAALILDDADVGLGDWGNNTQYTVNRQTVYGEMMRLCDEPEEVEGHPVPRVPIILVGNNLGRLYGPLVREGRMTLLEWALLPEELIRVLSGIFPELTPVEVQKVAATFPDATTAFFSDIRRRLEDSQLLATLKGLSPRDLLRQGALCSLPASLGVEITLACVLETGRTAETTRVLPNHIQQVDLESVAGDFLLSRQEAPEPDLQEKYL